jgi:hypothetical protein
MSVVRQGLFVAIAISGVAFAGTANGGQGRSSWW